MITLRAQLTRLWIAILSAGVLVASTAAVNPAAAKPKKEDSLQEITFVVALAAGETIDDVAADHDLTVIGAERPERDLWSVAASVSVDDKDPEKDVEKYLESLGKKKEIRYAVPTGDVDGSRFFAWPAGKQSDADAGRPVQDLLSGEGDLTGAGVRIAVLDTGFDMDHPLLAERYRSPIDLLDGDTHPSDLLDGVDDDGDGWVDEAHGHGTFVAGIIAQLAPDAEIVPIRVLEADGTGELYDVIDGIDAAVERDVDIINISFGTTTKINAVEAAVKRAQKAGVIVVASAGNAGNEEKQYPAAHGKVIAVAAFDEATDGVPNWGTHGNWVDVSAPGVDLVSARPGGRMTTWSGSSMAAPIVSAQVALMLENGGKGLDKDAEKEVRKAARKTNGERTSKDGVIGQGHWLGKLDD